VRRRLLDARGWLGPGWALAGRLFCAFRFGILSDWMNGYMGGGVAAIGGALALGAFPRLMKIRKSYAAFLLAFGVAIVLFTRPYQGLLFGAAIGAFVLVWARRVGWDTLGKWKQSIAMPMLAASILAGERRPITTIE
jgi:hypothetical protein